MYKNIWDATIGEELECARESDNPTDCYAVAVKKDNETVRHVPRVIPRMCAVFLERTGCVKAPSCHALRWNQIRKEEIPFCWHFQSTVVYLTRGH